VASLLPPNATALERAAEAATARVGEVEVPIATLWDPDRCPAALLPYLAWALSVDDWSPEWPERIKRAVIRAAIAVHRTKGTIGALHRALEAMDLDLIRVIEWFEEEPAGEPYTFRVEVGTISRGLSEDEWDAILAAVRKAKNTRSHLKDLRVYLQVQSTVPYVGGACLGGESVTVYPYTITEREQLGAVPLFAAAYQSVETTTVYPGT